MGELLTNSVQIGLYSHPTNSMLGRNITPIVERKVKYHSDDCEYWIFLHCDGKTCAIALVHMFRNKSQTCLNSSEFKLYPLQVTLFNC